LIEEVDVEATRVHGAEVRDCSCSLCCVVYAFWVVMYVLASVLLMHYCRMIEGWRDIILDEYCWRKSMEKKRLLRHDCSLHGNLLGKREGRKVLRTKGQRTDSGRIPAAAVLCPILLELVHPFIMQIHIPRFLANQCHREPIPE
jgi:hypothetical protein